MKKEQESWRDIEGFEGLYQVSNWGRVKSLERIDSNGHPVKERILKPRRNRKGYLLVDLYKKDGKGKTFLVHRLVATAWLPNLENLPEINHIDENKTNNRVENLSWCDRAYNINYGTRNERVSIAMTNGKLSKPVIALDPKTGNVVAEFPSTQEAGRNGYDRRSISHCCKGERKTHRKLAWRYKEVS